MVGERASVDFQLVSKGRNDLKEVTSGYKKDETMCIILMKQRCIIEWLEIKLELICLCLIRKRVKREYQ